MKKNAFVIFGLSIVTLFFLYYIIQAKKKSNLSQNIQAPNIHFKFPNGQSSSLEAQKGKVVLVNFWAFWCGPCLDEMPELKALEKKLESKGFIILAFHADEVSERALSRLPLSTFPKNLIYDFSKESLEEYGIAQLPYSVLIDRTGQVRQVFRGAYPWTDPRIVSSIEQLL